MRDGVARNRAILAQFDTSTQVYDGNALYMLYARLHAHGKPTGASQQANAAVAATAPGPVPNSGATVEKKSTADLDGKDDEAVAMMKANPKLSNVKLAKLLKDTGIKRSKEWVRLKRLELGIGGLQVGEGRQPL